MGAESLFVMRICLLAVIGVYFVFAYFDSRRVKDEREDLIHLKSLELVQKGTLSIITVLTALFIFRPEMPALVPLAGVVLSSMVLEIAGKLYYRRRY